MEGNLLRQDVSRDASTTLTVLTQTFDILGRVCMARHPDSGAKLIWRDVASATLRSWDTPNTADERSQGFEYDELRRPVRRWVSGATAYLAEETTYGESLPDAKARNAMSYAALLAGMAFQLPKNAMVHACSFPLSNRYHLPHGVACALTLEGAIRLNAPCLGDRFAAFATACGFADAEAMAAAVHRLKRLGGLPCTLAEAGIPENAVETLIAESFHPLLQNNPRPITSADLRALYRELM